MEMCSYLQSKDYTESQFRLLCDHFGHTIDVHKRYYRLPDSSVTLAKVSKMLLRNEENEYVILNFLLIYMLKIKAIFLSETLVRT